MNKIKLSLMIIIGFLLFIQIGCSHYPLIQEPDVHQFKETVYSVALRDSLLEGKLTAGMPYFVITQLFKDWTDGIKEVKIPVATLGSKQRIVEEEGWNRQFVDPNIKAFLDIYETPKGKLYVWYQRPDFYTMDVSARDTLYVIFEDSTYSSAINYLSKSSVLTIKDSLSDLPTQTNFYAEIHYNDHPWRTVSYWYNLEMLSNDRTFKIGEINYELYPVELLEFNNEPVTSFKWREVNEDEN
jgi:hypothetical protein